MYSSDKNLTIAEILAYRHCSDGFDALISEAREAEKASRLKEYSQLLGLITRAGLSAPEKRNIAASELLKAAEGFTAGADAVTQRGGPYAWSKEHARVIGNNTLLLSICRCASALGDREFAGPLMKIEAMPELHGGYAPVLHEEKPEQTWEKEYALFPNDNIFLTFTRIKVLQAASACGSREASEKLGEYRDHPISLIRRIAEKAGYPKS